MNGKEMEGRRKREDGQEWGEQRGGRRSQEAGTLSFCSDPDIPVDITHPNKRWPPAQAQINTPQSPFPDSPWRTASPLLHHRLLERSPFEFYFLVKNHVEILVPTHAEAAGSCRLLAGSFCLAEIKRLEHPFVTCSRV